MTDGGDAAFGIGFEEGARSWESVWVCFAVLVGYAFALECDPDSLGEGTERLVGVGEMELRNVPEAGGVEFEVGVFAVFLDCG